MVEKKEIVVIGLNHKTAPVEVRECLAFAAEDNPQVLERIRLEPHVDEVVLFSTCNRVEFLLATQDVSRAAGQVVPEEPFSLPKFLKFQQFLLTLIINPPSSYYKFCEVIISVSLFFLRYNLRY